MKAVAALLEVCPQLGKIVDLAVENHPDRPVLIENGLVPTRQVNDAEAAHPQADTVLDEDSLVIRTSVHDSLAHAVDCAGFNPVVGSRTDNACDSAHGLAFRQPSEPGAA